MEMATVNILTNNFIETWTLSGPSGDTMGVGPATIATVPGDYTFSSPIVPAVNRFYTPHPPSLSVGSGGTIDFTVTYGPVSPTVGDIDINMIDVSTGLDLPIAGWEVTDALGSSVFYFGMGSTDLTVPTGIYCFKVLPVPGYTVLSEDSFCKLLAPDEEITFGAAFLDDSAITGSITVTPFDVTNGVDLLSAAWTLSDSPGGTVLLSGVGPTVIPSVPVGTYCLDAMPVPDYILTGSDGCEEVFASTTTDFDSFYEVDPLSLLGSITIDGNLPDFPWTVTDPLGAPLFTGMGPATVSGVMAGDYGFEPGVVDCYDAVVVGPDTGTLAPAGVLPFEADYTDITARTLKVKSDIPGGSGEVRDSLGTLIGSFSGDKFTTFDLPGPDTYTISFDDVVAHETPEPIIVDASACDFKEKVIGDYRGRDLALSLLIPDDDFVAPGDEINYRIEFNNPGEVDVDGVIVTFDYDETKEMVVSAPGFVDDGEKLTMTLQSPLSPSATPIATNVKVRVKEDGTDGMDYTVEAEITTTVPIIELTTLNNRKDADISVDVLNGSFMKKRVTNLSGDGITSTFVKAYENDELEYVLSIRPETDLDGFVFEDDISDILEYAKVLDKDGKKMSDPEIGEPFGGGTFLAGTMTWPPMDVKACAEPQLDDCGAEVKFRVRMKKNFGKKGDFRATNSFGKDVTVVAIPKLELHKTGSVNGGEPALTGVAQPGDKITYVLSITNNASFDHEGVIFQDFLGDVLKAGGIESAVIVDAETDPGYIVEDDIIFWKTPVTIPVGETIKRTFTVQIPNPLIAEEALTLRNVYGDVVTEFLIVDLELSKKVFNRSTGEAGTHVSAKEGDELEYVISIVNPSTIAGYDDFVPMDDISDFVGVIDFATLMISDSGTYDSVTRKITWPTVSLGSEEEITRSFKFTILDDDLWPVEFDKILTNVFGNRVDVSLEGSQDRIDLVITKTADKEGETVMTDDEIVYTIEYWNEGATDASNAFIVDDFDESLVKIKKSTLPPGAKIETQNGNKFIRFDTSVIGDVPSGDFIGTITYTAKVISSERDKDIVNTAAISGEQTENDLGDNQASSFLRLKSEPITVVKSVDPFSIDNGTVTYRIVVENTTDETISDVRVTDTIAAGGIVYTNGGSVTYTDSMTVTFNPGPNGEVGTFTGDIGIDEVELDDIPGRRAVIIEYTADVSNSTVPVDESSIASNSVTVDYRIGLKDFSDTDTADVMILGDGSLQPGKIEVHTNQPGATFNIAGPDSLVGAGTLDTFMNVTPGSYTITYGSIFGLVPPLPETKELIAGETTIFEGLYSSEGDGSIQVKSNLGQSTHSVVAEANDVEKFGGGTDTIYDDLPSDIYTVTCDPVPDFVGPDPQVVKLFPEELIMVNCTYTPEPMGEPGKVIVTNNIASGSARVTCQSIGASPIDYETSGLMTEITMVEKGECTAVWYEISGFDTPEAQIGNVEPDETLIFDGEYIAKASLSAPGSSGGGGGGGSSLSGIGGVKIRDDKQIVTLEHLLSLNGVDFSEVKELDFGTFYELDFLIKVNNQGNFAAKDLEISSLTTVTGDTANNGLVASLVSESYLDAAMLSGWEVGDVSGVNGATYDPISKKFTIASIPSNSTHEINFKIPITTSLRGNKKLESIVTLDHFDLDLSLVEDEVIREGIGLGDTAVAFTGLLAEDTVEPVSDSGALEANGEGEDNGSTFTIGSNGYTITITANKSKASAGDTIRFTMNVKNESGQDATNFRLFANYGHYLDPVDDGTMDDGREVSWAKPIFMNDETLTYSFDAVAKSIFKVNDVAKVIAKFNVEEVDPENLPIAFVDVAGSDTIGVAHKTGAVAPARARRSLPATGRSEIGISPKLIEVLDFLSKGDGLRPRKVVEYLYR